MRTVSVRCRWFLTCHRPGFRKLDLKNPTLVAHDLAGIAACRADQRTKCCPASVTERLRLRTDPYVSEGLSISYRVRLQISSAALRKQRARSFARRETIVAMAVSP
jgi:hypothetical protein